MNDLFCDVKYIPLQFSSEILIGNNPDFFIVDNFIIVNDGDNCFQFNKENGKFVKKIGTKGRGPNEYSSTRGFINPINKTIYLLGWQGTLLEFDLNGKHIRKITIPEYIDNFSNPSFSTNYTYIHNDIIAYFTNSTGNENKLLMIFTNDSEIISIHNNSNTFPDKHLSISTGESHFYHFDNHLFFKENYCDTIYRVTRGLLLPHIVLLTGDYLRPYESKWWPHTKLKSQFIYPYNLIETSSHFIFRFFYNYHSFLGVFDKHSGTLNISEWETGIINNIYNFIPFSPLTKMEGDKIIGYIDAWKVQQWFKDNPDKSAELPTHLKNLENITENDNPVVMIAKLKE